MEVAVPRSALKPTPALRPHRAPADIAFHLVLFTAALGLIWAGRTYGTAALQRWATPVPFAAPVDLAIAIGAVFGAVWLHECGHFVAAMLMGFEFMGASLGPVQVQTMHGKWKWSFQAKRLFSGSVSAVPRSMEYWRARMAIVIAAGPAATLASALMVANGVGGPVFQLTFVQVSGLIFLLGFIPNSSRSARRNDMRLMVDLAFGNAGCEEMELFLLQTQHPLNGGRPRDYAPALIGRLAAWRGRPEAELAFAGTVMRWAADSEDLELAAAWDSRAVALAEGCDGRARNGALAWSACLDVICREDVETARAKFERVDANGLFPPCLQHLARAAEHVARGRCYRAPAEIIRAQYALPKGVTAYGFERELIERLHMLALRGGVQKSQGACA